MNKHLALTTLAVLFPSINAATAATCWYNDSWKPQHASTQTNLIKETKILEERVAFEGATTLEQVLGALKVVNKQGSGEASRLQTTVKQSQEAYANTMMEQARREKLVSIKENYSYESGQGVNACAQVNFLGQVTAALDGASGAGTTIYKGLDIAPGQVPSPEDQASDRMDPSSTDASVIMAGGSAEQKRKFIQQLAGFAVVKPGKEQAGTVNGELMMMRARQAEAWRSPALYSISYVAGLTDKSTGSGDSAGSVIGAMDALIDNYGGGPAYTKWSAGLQTQSERGLLIEVNRLRSLSMKLRALLSDSTRRQAAVSASLLAAEATVK